MLLGSYVFAYKLCLYGLGIKNKNVLTAFKKKRKEKKKNHKQMKTNKQKSHGALWW